MVYQHPKVPLPVRMRAASMAIPFERPALKAHALMVAEGDFAKRLEAAIERSGITKVIEAKPEPGPLPPVGPEPTPMNAPFNWPAPGLDDTQLSESSLSLELHRA